MRTLLIGGSGHVSGAVARAAVAAGHEVWAVTRGRRPLPAGVQAIVADRQAGEALLEAMRSLSQDWDLVVDCICYDLPDLQQDLALCRDRVAQFVLISTDFVYDPERRSFPQPEDAPTLESPGSGSQEYGHKKRQCEVALLEGAGDLAWTILRPCHIYGATSELGCFPCHGRDPHLLDRLRAGEALRLVGGGHFLQQPLSVDDLAQTVVSVAGQARARHEICNVAGPDLIESWQYYRIVAEALGVELRVEELPVGEYLAAHPEEAPFLCHRFSDRRRLEQIGLHRPDTPVIEGLRQHVEGLRERRKSAP